MSQTARVSVALTLVLIGLTSIACGGGGDDPTETFAPDTTSISEAATSTRAQSVATRTRTAKPVATPAATKSTSGTTATPAGSPLATATPIAPTPTIPPVPTQVPPPPPQTVTGSGTGITEPIQFPEGIAVVTINHSGAERFKVRLQSTESQFDRDVGEGTGTWKGSKGLMIRNPGEYVFSVQADGDWQIDVMWPTPETASVSETPFNYSGAGDQAVYFVLVQTGQHTLSLTHDGDGAFSVSTITSEGRDYIDKLSGSGPMSASVEFTIHEKAFEFLLLNVKAAANWTIDLQ